MTDPRELKRQQLLAAMAQSLATPATNPSLPAPTPPVDSTAGLAPPPQLQGQQPTAPAPGSVRVGFGAQGLHGVDRDMLKRTAQREADPESKVTDTGDFIDIAPPRGKHEKPEHGLLSRLARGAGLGAATSNPDNPNSVLGGLIGGALGGISPRNFARNERRYDVAKTEDDIARGLKLETDQAQLGGIQALGRQRDAQPALEAAEIDRKAYYDRERLRNEELRVQGLLTKAQADAANRELDRRSREERDKENRASREREGQANRENQRTIAGMPARSNGDKTAEHEAKRTAQLNLSSSLYKKADALDAQAKSLEGKPDPYGDLAKQMTDLTGEARKLREDGDKARAEGEAIPAQNAGAPHSGRTMSKANLARYAKDHNMTVEQAKASDELKGVTIR